MEKTLSSIEPIESRMNENLCIYLKYDIKFAVRPGLSVGGRKMMIRSRHMNYNFMSKVIQHKNNNDRIVSNDFKTLILNIFYTLKCLRDKTHRISIS